MPDLALGVDRQWVWNNHGGQVCARSCHEQSRNCRLSSEEGEQVNHLCHRPFCIQPAHLYLGNAQTNAEDRKARQSEMSTYATWDQLGDRHDRAMTGHYWEPPETEAISPSFNKPLECPHEFDTIRSGGDARGYAPTAET